MKKTTLFTWCLAALSLSASAADVFYENCGDTKVSKPWQSVTEYQGWKNQAPVTFTSTTANYPDVRSTSTLDNHIWFPAGKECDVVISNIPANGYNNLKLTFDVTSNKGGADNTGVIVVECNDQALTVPSIDIAKQNEYVSLPEITLNSAPMLKLRLYIPSDNNKNGFRIDNIKITGDQGAELPSITAENTLEFGQVNVNENIVKPLTVTGSLLTEAITYTITGTDAAMFTTSDALTAEGGTLNIKFQPTASGVCEATLTLTSGTATATVALSGTGYDANNPFGLNPSNPVTELNQTFENVSNNQNFEEAGWINIAEQGDRVWQGAIFTNTTTQQTDKYIKATAHNATDGQEYKMWIITPAFNLDQVTNKEAFFDCTDAFYTATTTGSSLKVYFLQLVNGVMVKNEIPVAGIPTVVENNYVWVTNLRIDMSAYSGVGFIGFEYTGMGGSSKSATYCLDNIRATINGSGINNTTTQKNTIYAADGNLYINATAGETIRIYNTVGQLVKTVQATDAQTVIPVERHQLLIVKAGDKAVKVKM